MSMRFFLDGGVLITMVMGAGCSLLGVLKGDLPFMGVVITWAMAAMMSTAFLVGVLAGGVTTTEGDDPNRCCEYAPGFPGTATLTGVHRMSARLRGVSVALPLGASGASKCNSVDSLRMSASVACFARDATSSRRRW